MKSKWMWALLLVVVGAAVYAGTVLATTPRGVTTTTFGVGRFDNIDSTTKTDINSGAATDHDLRAFQREFLTDLGAGRIDEHEARLRRAGLWRGHVDLGDACLPLAHECAPECGPLPMMALV